MGAGIGREVTGNRPGPGLDQKAYAERLGVTYNIFRLAYALALAAAEGRELSSSAFRMPLVRETARRIAPPSRLVGRSPAWDVADVERFEEHLMAGEPHVAPTPPRRTRGRPRRAEKVLSDASRDELCRALSQAALGDTAGRVFAARYGLDGRDAFPTTLQLAEELGISRQAVWEAFSRAERKVKRALLEGRQDTG